MQELERKKQELDKTRARLNMQELERKKTEPERTRTRERERTCKS
jgi:hypothetical protein